MADFYLNIKDKEQAMIYLKKAYEISSNAKYLDRIRNLKN